MPSPVRVASVVTLLSRSLAKFAKHGISVIFFIISLKSSSFLSGQFCSDFFRSSYIGRLLSESLSRNFAIFCIAPRNDFSSSLDVGGFNSKTTFIFFLFASFPCSFFFVSQPGFFQEKISDLFSVALYPAFWSFSSIEKIFFQLIFLSFLAATIISSSHMGVQ